MKEYWLVDPQERTVEVTSLRDGVLETVSLSGAGAIVLSPLLPGLTMAVNDLIAQ